MTMTLDDVLEQSGALLSAGKVPSSDQLVEWREAMALHLTQPAQSVDVYEIRRIADFLRILSPDGEKWRSSNKSNPVVIDLHELADNLTAALQEKGNG